MATESEELARLEGYLDLFLHPQWKLFITECQEDYDYLDSVRAISSAEALHFRRGELYRLRGILEFEAQIRTQLEHFEEPVDEFEAF